MQTASMSAKGGPDVFSIWVAGGGYEPALPLPLQLPKHIDEEAILAAISIEKDVDGFHPLNIGKLCMKGRNPLFVPCTPLGCMVLLERCGIEIKGKRAVVVGRSNIVGLPAAMLLNERDATVTIVHSRTTVRLPATAETWLRCRPATAHHLLQGHKAGAAKLT